MILHRMLLSYIPQHNRVYLIDKSLNIYSYCILKSILDYQQAIINQDFKEADTLLEQIPKENIPKLAKFLEANEMKELAYKITTDYDQK
jgi:coatomer subunit beta'